MSISVFNVSMADDPDVVDTRPEAGNATKSLTEVEMPKLQFVSEWKQWAQMMNYHRIF